MLFGVCLIVAGVTMAFPKLGIPGIIAGLSLILAGLITLLPITIS